MNNPARSQDNIRTREPVCQPAMSDLNADTERPNMNAIAILSSPVAAVALIRANPLAALEQAFFAGRNERTLRA